MPHVFVCFLEEIDDNKKTFRNHLTFSKLENINFKILGHETTSNEKLPKHAFSKLPIFSTEMKYRNRHKFITKNMWSKNANILDQIQFSY